VISFCVSHYNRNDRLLELVDSLLKFKEQVIVANFVDGTMALPSHGALVVLNIKKPFHKSLGMNRCAERATGPIICFLDVDMVVPANFITSIKRVLRPGSCYFPICFSLYEGRPAAAATRNGYWREKGYGNCAFMIEDFNSIGRMDEQFVSWGGEDTDLFNRAKARLIVHRQPCDGLFHRWHPQQVW
jgi:glycosyltransferase involved in cell wall biosynthesis